MSTALSFFLKQGAGPDAISTITNEAFAYEWLELHAEKPSLTPYLPRFLGYDRHEKVLILELVRNAATLRESQLANRKIALRPFRSLAKALASLHQIGVPEVRGWIVCRLPFCPFIALARERSVSSAVLPRK